MQHSAILSSVSNKLKSKFDLSFLGDSHPERQKCLLMGALIFLTVLGYNLMRGMKEAVLVSLTGAAYLPIVKSCVVLPSAFLLSAVYLTIRHRYGIIRAYFITTLFFLSYFLVFCLYISPNYSALHYDDAWVTSMQAAYPSFRVAFVLIANWAGALYYTCAELWGTFSLTILFWQLANESFTSKEAEKSYPVIQVFSSAGLVSASFLLYVLSLVGDDSLLIRTSTFSLLLLAVPMLVLVYALSVNHPIPHSPGRAVRNPKKNISLYQCLRTALANPLVLYLAICVLSFSIMVNVLEVNVKEKMSLIFPSKKGYLHYMAVFTYYKGVFCTLANLLSVYYRRHLKWHIRSAITPVVCIIAVNGFLSYSAGYLNFALPGPESIPESAAWMGVFFSTLIYVAKYTFFDSTKEMAYIPLQSETKAHGKAAVDGLGGRLGKSSYGIILLGIFYISNTDSLQQALGYSICFTLICSVLWVWAIIRLQQEYASYQEQPPAKPSQTAVYNPINTELRPAQ